ncbi:MAG: glycosyl transferase [Nitrosomonas europaea]|nr:MAG: glycosyl transferase [Nitrosomonas europaea]
MIYDPIPDLYYRQHAANLIGENSGFIARFRRLT